MSAEILAHCSDEENYDLVEDPLVKAFLPSPVDIISLYKSLDAGNIPQLQWLCPGRRDPSVFEEEAPESEEEERMEEKSDFDFADEPTAPKLGVPRRTPSTQSGPRGSAKKKTTSFDGVLSSIRKYRKLEAVEKKEAKKSTPSFTSNASSQANAPQDPAPTQS